MLGLLGAAALAIAWRTQQRVHELEQELVRRQQDSQVHATEARTLARQAQESAREALTKAGLLEGRVAEVALQRGQLEDLIQSLSRSRDENVLVDIEAALRVAQQQSAITGIGRAAGGHAPAGRRAARTLQPAAPRRRAPRDRARPRSREGGRRGRHLGAQHQARRSGAPGRRAAVARGGRAAQAAPFCATARRGPRRRERAGGCERARQAGGHRCASTPGTGPTSRGTRCAR